MKILDPWSPVVLQEHFSMDWESIKPVVDRMFMELRGNSELEIGGTSTVELNARGINPIMMPEFRELQRYIDSKLPQVIDTWKIPRAMYGPLKSWINEHPKGAYTTEHVHRNTQIAVAYYLKVPENSGRLLVRDPAEAYWINYPSQPRGLDEFWYPIDVKAGDIVFFPGWLQHKTEPNNSDENRYVMSINYSFL